MAFSITLNDHEKATLDTLWGEIKSGNIGKLEMYEIQHAVDLVKKLQREPGEYKSDLEIFVDFFLRQDRLNLD